MKRNPFRNPFVILVVAFIMGFPVLASADTPAAPTTVNTLDNGTIAVVNVAPVGLIVANVANTPVDTANSTLDNAPQESIVIMMSPSDQATEAANATNESAGANANHTAVPHALFMWKAKTANPTAQMHTFAAPASDNILMQTQNGGQMIFTEVNIGEENSAPAVPLPLDRGANASHGGFDVMMR